MLKKSPSGSLCPYYYMGGELHPLHYGSYFSDKKRLLNIIDQEEEFILHSNGKNNRNIWIDLYETVLDEQLIKYLVEHLIAISEKIHRLCLVGCSFASQIKIKKELKKLDSNLYQTTRFFEDPEDAKKWLLGKPL